MLKLRLFVFFLSAISAVSITLSPGLEAAGDNFKPPLRILQSASELDYPPFALVRDDGTADGFSVELLKHVVKSVGMDVEINVGPWNKIRRELINGQIDVLPLVSYSQKRDESLDFTAPYLRMHGTILVRKGENKINSEADLKDREVLVMRGDTAHEYAVRNKLTDKLILTDSFEDALKQLAAGKHDAVIIQHLVGLQLIKKLNLSNVVSVRSFEESSLKPGAQLLSGFEQKFCIAVKEGDKQLLARLNEGLSIVFASGIYNELYEKWFGPILPKPSVSPIILFRYIFFILFPVLVLIGFFGIWYLRREISRKTEIIKENEEMFSVVFNKSPIPVSLSRLRDGVLIDVNESWIEAFGFDRDSVIGKTLSDLGISRIAAERVRLDTELRDKGYIHNMEVTGFRTKSNPSPILLTNVEVLEFASDKLVYTSTQDITDRKQAEALLREREECIKASLLEKEVLLKEIHHRVKNNMQVISSLVDLQAAEVEDAAMREIFKDVVFRVRSMAMVHEKLYQSSDLARVEFADYTRSLLGYMWRAQQAASLGVELDLELEPAFLPVNMAVPCALILNELSCNALKHAFVGRKSGKVTVSLSGNEKGKVTLRVRDNGIGLPPELDWEKSHSLGMRLVQMLARQLHAAVAVSSDNGAEIKIKFEIPET